MAVFEMKDATDVFMRQADQISSLWGVFVAASFAASGFGVSARKLNWVIRLGVTLAYLGFAYGHGSLVFYMLRAHQALRDDILMQVADAGPFQHSVTVLADTAAKMQMSLFFHVVVDVAVVLALWSAPLETRFKGGRTAEAARA